MALELCQSTFSGGVAGEPFCTGLRKRLGYRPRQGDGRWRVWDAGTAPALMGGLRMGRGPASRGDARGSDGRRGPGETGGGRSQSPAEEGRRHGSFFRELSLAEGQRRSSHPETPSQTRRGTDAPCRLWWEGSQQEDRDTSLQVKEREATDWRKGDYGVGKRNPSGKRHE